MESRWKSCGSFHVFHATRKYNLGQKTVNFACSWSAWWSTAGYCNHCCKCLIFWKENLLMQRILLNVLSIVCRKIPNFRICEPLLVCNYNMKPHENMKQMLFGTECDSHTHTQTEPKNNMISWFCLFLMPFEAAFLPKKPSNVKARVLLLWFIEGPDPLDKELWFIESPDPLDTPLIREFLTGVCCDFSENPVVYPVPKKKNYTFFQETYKTMELLLLCYTKGIQRGQVFSKSTSKKPQKKLWINLRRGGTFENSNN